MRNITIVSSFLSCVLFATQAYSGASGGGVGMKPKLLELQQVSRGAAEISTEIYGIPNN